MSNCHLVGSKELINGVLRVKKTDKKSESGGIAKCK